MVTNSIALSRKIKHWGWYTDANTFRVFIHLLLCANWKDGEYLGIPVKRGQAIVTQESIAKSLALTRDKVRVSLHKLKNTHEITQMNSGKYTIITITNYDTYQNNPQINPHVIPTLSPHPIIINNNKQNAHARTRAREGDVKNPPSRRYPLDEQEQGVLFQTPGGQLAIAEDWADMLLDRAEKQPEGWEPDLVDVQELRADHAYRLSQVDEIEQRRGVYADCSAEIAGSMLRLHNAGIAKSHALKKKHLQPALEHEIVIKKGAL